MRIQGKVWVVTGGGSGIGQRLVLGLLARGGRVAAVDLREEGLEETARLAQAGPRLSLHRLDVTDLEGVKALPDQVLAHHGQVDGLINNAGIIQPFKRVEELDYAVIERVFRVNFYGTLYMTKTFLPHLRARPEAHLVNISSMGGFLPVPGQVLYGASKAAVKLLTEGLYAELLGTSVRVSVVFPGAVATEIAVHSRVQIPSPKEGPKVQPLAPEEAARIILNGIEQNRFRILVGRDARLMDLLYRLHPERATHLIQRQMRALLPGDPGSSPA